MRRLAALLLSLFALAGCEDQFGVAASYHPRSEHPLAVTMPPNAPKIGRQYVPVIEGQPGTGHLGIDIWTHIGTPVLAAAPGTVTHVFFDPAYGRRITVDHGTDETRRRVATRYFHLSATDVAVGDVVARGQRIGLSGASGALAGFPHLHFEVGTRPSRFELNPLDPNLFWRDGPGRVSCYEPMAPELRARFYTTMPVRCLPDLG